MQTKNIILCICATFIALLLAEALIRKTTRHPINTEIDNKTHDKVLIYRMNTEMEGIDKNGFRNEHALDQADIVAIGDSHTYCFNAQNEQTWPNILKRKTNKNVYNLGIGGYGFLQYFALTKKAIALKPKYILIALYLPNDLEDVANTITLSKYWQTYFKDQNINIDNIFDSTQLNIPTNNLTNWIEKLFFTSATASLIRETLQQKTKTLFFLKDNKKDLILKDDNQNTIFTDIKIQTLKAYLDLDVPHIKNALDIAKILLKRIIKEIKDAEIEPIIVFIPSKENTFYEYLKEKQYTLSEDFKSLVERERNLTELFCKFLDNENTRHIKIKDYIDNNNCIKTTKQIYPKYDDEHVTASGYEIYAEAIYQFLKKQ